MVKAKVNVETAMEETLEDIARICNLYKYGNLTMASALNKICKRMSEWEFHL